MAEQRFVEPPVAGSSPAGHPNSLFCLTRYAAHMNSRAGRIMVILVLVAFVGLMILPLLLPTS